MNRQIELVICDDHQSYREGLVSIFEDVDNVQVVAQAENGKVCLEKVREYDPHIVLLDLEMPDMDGISCCEEMKKNHPEVKVIVLTQHKEKQFVNKLLKVGASGYLSKNTSGAELVLAITRVWNGKSYMGKEVAKQALSYLPNEPNPINPKLSIRELEILQLICDGHSTKQMATELKISTHTIETHRTNILKKSGQPNLAKLVRWAVEGGFI